MLALLDIVVANVAVAAVLALAAALLARHCNRPAWVHGLCLLALIKLVTPPLFTVPVLPDLTPAAAAAPVLPAPPGSLLIAQLPAGAPVRATVRPAPRPLPWGELALAVWLAGSAALIGLYVVRSRRLARLVRHARPAPRALQTEARRLAGHIGLRRTPPVLLVPARISPMLCPSRGRLRLLLPAGLVGRLDPDGRAALLVHELAHAHRRDHFVRHLELAVVIAYWWLPLVWWLRRNLRDAEEQCCDAWVVWALPNRARAYADALLETVDFLAGVRCALPPQASGVGPVHNLKQRIMKIMRAHPPHKMTARGRALALALTALTLPVLPTMAQEKAQSRTEARLDEALERIEQLERLVHKLLRAQIRATENRIDTVADPYRAGKPGARVTEEEPVEDPTLVEEVEIEEIEEVEEPDELISINLEHIEPTRITFERYRKLQPEWRYLIGRGFEQDPDQAMAKAARNYLQALTLEGVTEKPLARENQRLRDELDQRDTEIADLRTRLTALEALLAEKIAKERRRRTMR